MNYFIDHDLSLNEESKFEGRQNNDPINYQPTGGDFVKVSAQMQNLP